MTASFDNLETAPEAVLAERGTEPEQGVEMVSRAALEAMLAEVGHARRLKKDALFEVQASTHGAEPAPRCRGKAGLEWLTSYGSKCSESEAMNQPQIPFRATIEEARREEEITAQIHGRTVRLRDDLATAQHFAHVLFANKKVGRVKLADLMIHSLNATQTVVPSDKLLMRLQNLENILLILASAYRPGTHVAECGVFRGASALMILTFLKAHFADLDPRTVYLFDSFTGFDTYGKADMRTVYNDSGDVDAQVGLMGFLPDMERDVRRVLKDFDGVNIQAGFFKDTFSAVPEDARFSFVHIDADLYQATLECLEFFYPRMVPGGVILLDDYQASLFPGVRRALDEFMEARGEIYAVLPSSQAVWRKQATS